MVRMALLGGTSLLLLALAACGAADVGTINPYQTLADTFGVTPVGGPSTDGDRPSGDPVTGAFRAQLTVRFENTHTSAQVATSWVAWIEAGSVRSAQQEDDVFRAGYTRLTRELRLGSVFRLPIGTFVYNGPGFAGASPIRLGIPGKAVGSPTAELSILTPDVFLLFSQPPVSCDSVAYELLDERGAVLTGPVTGPGGYKTFAQVDVYQCEPLRPGLFLKGGGGAAARNEFFEGGTVSFTFNEGPDADGNFAIVQMLN